MSRDTQTSCHLVLPVSLNRHINPPGIGNPKYQCHLNSKIQLPLSILRTIGHKFKFNSRTSKCLFETAHGASSFTDVDALKFRKLQNDTFYGGQIQEYSSECLIFLIQVISKGSVFYCGSNDNNSTRLFISEIVSSFLLENASSAMHVDWDLPRLSLVVCYILHLLILIPCRIDNARNATKIKIVLLLM